MEKIKITVEQEEALKTWKVNEEMFVAFIQEVGSWKGGIYEPLNDFTPQQFALLLCRWYEVEQPFEVGNWVRVVGQENYFKIEKFFNEDVLFTNGGWDFINNLNEDYEKVTEPYKIMLLELGREKPEFATGDKYSTDDGKHYSIKDGAHTLECLQFFKDGVVEYFYPVESRIEVPKNV